MKKSTIVKILAASALLTLGIAATSFAAKGDKEIDLSIGVATSSDTGYDGGYAGYGDSSFGTGFGMSVGGGYELLDIKAIKGSTLQIRGDIGYNRWSDSVYGEDLKFTRVPVSAGARLYVPIQTVKKLRVYGETSLELSFDSFDTPSINLGGLVVGGSHSETNIGLVPGAGVEYGITPNIFLGGNLKYHIVSGGYLNALFGIGYKF